MKKLLLLLIIFILAINLVNAQNEWITYKIDDKLSVNLPAPPTKLNENAVYVKGNDSTVYIVAIVDLLKNGGLDAAQVASQSPTTEFADKLKEGMMSEMSGTTLGDVSISNWKSYTCYHINGVTISKKLNFYSFMVFIGINVYSIMVVSPDSHSPAEKDTFFNSLVLNK